MEKLELKKELEKLENEEKKPRKKFLNDENKKESVIVSIDNIITLFNGEILGIDEDDEFFIFIAGMCRFVVNNQK